MFGIYAFNLLDEQLDSDALKWNRACRRGAAPDDNRHKTENEAFTKRDFIALYIEEHARRIAGRGRLDPAAQEGRA